ncbi:hypothetical protein H2203_002963 [Taxawa tesnikishii (nom. ined.)]|nr:hypothetical protein H2203_002963 [Dothideales sp. JES 119]
MSLKGFLQDGSALLRGLASNGRFEPRYEPVNGFGAEPSEKQARKSSSGWGKYLVIALIVLVPVFIYEYLPSVHRFTPHSSAGRPTEKSKPGTFHVLMPAEKRDLKLCRAMISASALDYPTPAVVGWNMTHDQSTGFHVTKISGVLSYLRHLEAKRSEDLVLVADATNNFFQLRPQTLIDRYYEIIQGGNRRIRSKLGRAAQAENIEQKIVFQAQKRYMELPEAKNPYSRIRPRYLASGVIMGPVGAMKQLFMEASFRAMQDPHSGSGDQIFSQLFAEQELHRELMRQKHLTYVGRFSAFVSGVFGGPSDQVKQHLKQVNEMATLQKRSLDFGIGLDYEGLIGLTTGWAEDNLEFLTHGDLTQVRAAAKARQITSVKAETLQADVATSLPPFWTFGTQPLPRNRAWKDVSLLTDMRTGVVPAIINHDSKGDGLDNVRDNWWDKTWFHEHARTYYTARLNEPVVPVAVSGPAGKPPREWWSIDNWRGGVRNPNYKAKGWNADEVYGSGAPGLWLRYEDICTGFSKEVFGDEKGDWWLPEDH